MQQLSVRAILLAAMSVALLRIAFLWWRKVPALKRELRDLGEP